MQALVATKCEDTKLREVPHLHGEAIADYHAIPFFETSAKEGINVHEVRHETIALLKGVWHPDSTCSAVSCGHAATIKHAHAVSPKHFSLQ